MALTPEQALDCFRSDDLIGIGMEADAVRRRLHPEGIVGYALDRVVDASAALETLLQHADNAVDEAAPGVLLTGLGKLQLPEACLRLRTLRERLPSLTLRCSGVCAVHYLAERSEVDLPHALAQLQGAGLASIGSGGIDLVGFDQWLSFHRAAHSLGIPTAAALCFGGAQEPSRSLADLEALQTLQAELGGFVSFTLISTPAATGRELDDPTAVEYLKTLAVCRMALELIPNVEANWQQQGLKVLQMALRFGANDVGSLYTVDDSAPEEEVRRLIRDAGFEPRQRDTLYRTFFLI